MFFYISYGVQEAIVGVKEAIALSKGLLIGSGKVHWPNTFKIKVAV